MARKILLADDSVTAQNMGRKILADAGYDVVTVNNGSAALKRIAEIKPDLIVLDVYMPGYSGLEVCQRLKDAPETAHIPVLLTVGKLEPFKAEEGRRVKADHHIVKPFEASELLTAITRLEDRIVPQHSVGAEPFNGKGNRTSDRTSESNGDADTGWKSRLSFSKKKKDEKEPAREEAAAGASFRDFRKAKGKSAASETLKSQATPTAEHAPELVSNVLPEVPRDITPEELDALSALASKLSSPSPDAELAAVQTEEEVSAAPETQEIEVQQETVEAPSQMVEVSSQTIEGSDQTRAPSQTIEASDETTEAIVRAVAPLAFAVASPASEARAELEIPVHYVEPAPESAVVEAVTNEAYQPEAPHLETPNPEAPAPEIPVLMEVNTALLAEEPSPIDRDDEPTFASSANEVEPSVEESVQAGEAVAASAGSEASASETVTAEYPELQPQQASEATEESKAEETSRHDSAAAIQREAENAAPSDAELVEALRLLTPATPFADFLSVPPRETLAAAGQLLAEQAVLNAASGPRWIAEPMTLSPEEAAISLEAEMMLTLASTTAVGPGSEIDPGEISGVSAIAAAVENRLAHLAEATETEDCSGRDAAASSQVEPVSEMAAVETSSPETPSLESHSEESHSVEVTAEIMAACDSSNPAENQTEKLDAPASEEAPKAMAAAAAENSAYTSAADASTIARIVDSVMADLRPRIVEEIARKLAKRD